MRSPFSPLSAISVLCAVLAGGLGSFGTLQGLAGEVEHVDRLYVNDKRAPDDLRDLRNIQEALQTSLAQARAATVGIELGEGSGSGVIINEQGLVLTAAHVATGVDTEITVVLEDGTKLLARTLGLNSETDCAMAQIEHQEGKRFSYVKMDTEDSAQLGDWVFALGHSGGVDQARGSVVRLGRLVRVAPETIQSDCKLIGGDSGGPLFDLAGRLIGIHSRVGRSLEQNMHVPLREFEKSWDQMLAGEFIGEGPFAEKPKPGTAFLGIAMEDRQEGGVLITRVGEDTPAEAAELQEGDLILSVNEETDLNQERLLEILSKAAPGERVTLTISRHEEIKTIEVELGER